MSFDQEGASAGQAAGQRTELDRTLARLRTGLPRFLSGDETAALIQTGRATLPVRTARGDRPFSHQALFSRPYGVLRLRRYPTPRLRFAAEDPRGAFFELALLEPFRPFLVEAVHDRPPDPAQRRDPAPGTPTRRRRGDATRGGRSGR